MKSRQYRKAAVRSGFDTVNVLLIQANQILTKSLCYKLVENTNGAIIVRGYVESLAKAERKCGELQNLDQGRLWSRQREPKIVVIVEM